VRSRGAHVGQIVAFTNYLLTTMTPLIMMTILSNIWAGGNASAGGSTRSSRPSPMCGTPRTRSPARAGAGRIVFKKVSFHYSGADAENVLDGIDLTVEAGQTVAFLGATGSGKSTLVNLVPRFMTSPPDGSSSTGPMFAADPGVAPRSDRRRPQETVLFSGTVRDNIRYGAGRRRR